jgi:plasmid stability protein
VEAEESAVNRMKVTSENKPVRVLLAIQGFDGVVRYEWREVPGTVLSLEGVELRSGDTLTIESQVRTNG